jgi:hypothetical protein
MSYLKRLSAEPLKEVQAVLRSNDIAKENLLFQTGENNPEALEDLRSYLQLCSMKSQQVVLHDMLEKRYSVRPFGWPDEEVLLLLVRLIVLSEISLIMDSTLLPIDKVYEAITTPAKRRKIIVRKREISDPKAIQNARSLGKDLFAEMGPDGEDGLCTFLQTKLKGWHGTLSGYKQLADTGNYPGGGEIMQGLTLISPLLADKESKKFVERFNTLKKDLLDVADHFHDLKNFHDHQKPTWEKLRKAHVAFQLNRLELEKDSQAGPALKRMHEILSAKSPYGLLKEADALINTVNAVNSSLLTGRRAQALAKIDEHIATLNQDIATVQGDAALRTACLKPLEELKEQVQKQESLAHITQAEGEAVKAFDAAIALGGLDSRIHYLLHLSVLWAVAASTWWLLSRWLSGDMAFAAAALFLAMPPTAWVANTLMTTHYAWGLLFSVLALCAWARAIAATSVFWAVTSALLYGLACLGKELYVPLVLVMLLWPGLGWRRGARLASPAIIVALAYLALRYHVLGGVGGYGAISADTQAKLTGGATGAA